MSLPLNDIVNVKAEVSAMSAPRKAFNIGLLIGSSTGITQTGRVALYASVDAMAAAGFTPGSDEYKAATLYFGQSPAPDLLAVGLIQDSETALEALSACRTANNEWYGFSYTTGVSDALTDADRLAIAAYVESVPVSTVWFNLVSDEGYLGKMQAMQTKKYSRTLTLYSTDGTATAAMLGYAMGANYKNAPAYTLASKTLVGVSTEDIDSTALDAILKANGNVYVNQGYYYTVLRSGKMANGVSFDDVIYLDMLVNGIELSVMDQLTQLPKIPQTQEGVNILVSAITDPCEEMAAKGYIAPGKWTGRKVRSLEPGDMLSKGYLVLADDINEQSQADRDARVAPPIYCCVKTAGAIESVVIGVVVNR